VNNVIVGHVIERKDVVGFNLLDKEACIVICGYFGSDPKCRDNKLINSVAAGCPFAGIVHPGHECGESAKNVHFIGNVAHSVEGCGAHIFPNAASAKTQDICYEGSHFAAYKTTQLGLATHFVSREIIMTNMTMIDNVLGINL